MHAHTCVVVVYWTMHLKRSGQSLQSLMPFNCLFTMKNSHNIFPWTIHLSLTWPCPWNGSHREALKNASKIPLNPIIFVYLDRSVLRVTKWLGLKCCPQDNPWLGPVVSPTCVGDALCMNTHKQSAAGDSKSNHKTSSAVVMACVGWGKSFCGCLQQITDESQHASGFCFFVSHC